LPQSHRHRGTYRWGTVMGDRFISGCCEGERCFCGAEATHKVEETIFYDDPFPNRHPFTAYICDEHFGQIMGEHWTSMLKDARHE
jgi:hypothetical protein